MLTEKQNQIIDQIKQEFENHNQVIDLRKNQKSRFNFESIISEIQRREDFISELKQITEILFVGKKIEGYYRVNTNYTFSFNGYIGSFSALFKNERVRERLAFLWEVHIKNKS